MEQSTASNFVAFTERERLFFQKQLGQLNSLVQAMNNATSLFLAQNGLEGQWSLREDGLGVVCAQPPAPPDPTAEDLSRLSAALGG